MLLIHNTVERACSAEMIDHWQSISKEIEDALAHIQRFVTGTETPTVAESPAAVHSETLQPHAHVTMLIERLRQCAV